MFQDTKPLRIVTGMHRSGTTWLGKVVSAAMPEAVVHEPFNAYSGLAGVDRWYFGPESAETANTLISDMLSGRRGFRRRRDDDGLFKGVARQIVGSRDDRELGRALRGEASAVVLKDPFLIRLCAALAQSRDARSVILIRHPAALVNSLRRMEWPIPELDHRPWPVRHEDPELQFAFALGAFWAALYDEVDAQKAEAPGNLHLVRHEDLCIEPLEQGAAALEHLGIPMTDDAQAFLEKSTSGGTGEMTGDTLHNMSRDARSLAFSWRNSLPADQIAAVTEGAGAVLQRHYGDMPAEFA